MNNQKEHCEKLYSKYQELVRKTQMTARNLKPAEEINNIPSIILEDMEEKHKIKEELYNCLEFLSDKQLKELHNDDDVKLVNAAVNIIAKRKKEDTRQ